ncbi:hypothetical protein ZIOFF_067750 [Zingiber officinale]|uniref:glucan endo-1,3-beta-D-glucosidase n=1 Tax=Zingiber officinale TaxID=94328 RepID=A0A8J5C6X7_ZINOF|nr:hypothetical protein ZIOFF_067750 [Zingiber officinale]
MDSPATVMWTYLAVAVAAAALASASTPVVPGLGVNWGTIMSHPMLPSTVVQMIQDNGIKKVKLFDADEWTLSAFAGTNIEVTIAIPNNQLARMSENCKNAKEWVKENVTKYDHAGIKINYVAVGNEPFLTSYNGTFIKTTFPALKNIQTALNEAGVGDRIKATVPLNADVYNSPSSNPVPSSGDFRSDIHDLMVDMVRFMHSHGSPFMVNIYPYLSLNLNPNFPVDYAFFDGGGRSISDNNHQYTNVFDANFDTLVWALKKAGVGDMKIVVGEVGWPTDGNEYATLSSAKRFYDGFLKRMAEKVGTPLRPGPMEAYLFGLIDEDMKSILPGNFERHWGIFTYDGRPKFPMDLSGNGNDKYLVGAKGVQYLPAQWCVLKPEVKDDSLVGTNIDYACYNADCTSLGYGSSCNQLDNRGNTSYAFNMYFQMQDQDVRACDFDGLAVTTTVNASQGNCLFPIQIVSSAPIPLAVARLAIGRVVLVAIVACALVNNRSEEQKYGNAEESEASAKTPSNAMKHTARFAQGV